MGTLHRSINAGWTMAKPWLCLGGAQCDVSPSTYSHGHRVSEFALPACAGSRRTTYGEVTEATETAGQPGCVWPTYVAVFPVSSVHVFY